MRTSSDIRRFVGVAATTLAGTIFFNVIIGVFDQQFAIAGLVLFVLVAIGIFRAFPVYGGTR